MPLPTGHQEIQFPAGFYKNDFKPFNGASKAKSLKPIVQSMNVKQNPIPDGPISTLQR